MFQIFFHVFSGPACFHPSPASVFWAIICLDGAQQAAVGWGWETLVGWDSLGGLLPLLPEASEGQGTGMLALELQLQPGLTSWLWS